MLLLLEPVLLQKFQQLVNTSQIVMLLFGLYYV